MGFPPLSYSITVIKDKALIERTKTAITGLYRKLYSAMKNPVARFFVRADCGSKSRYRLLKEHLIPLLATRLDDLESGKADTITRNAPVMMLFHGPKETDIRDDALLGACIASLSAQALGLGATILDIVHPGVNRLPELKKELHIPDGHEAAVTLILGYPKFRAARNIVRSFPSVDWIG